ncbi:MAG: hypothetical protein V3S56_09585, partial [Gemmatimonadota bacterium]
MTVVPGASDIPSRSPRGSGALPRIPVDQTGAAIEAAGGELMKVAQRFQAAEDRIRTRNEVVAEAKAEIAVSDGLAALELKYTSEQDLSSPEVMEALGQDVSALREGIESG